MKDIPGIVGGALKYGPTAQEGTAEGEEAQERGGWAREDFESIEE